MAFIAVDLNRHGRIRLFGGVSLLDSGHCISQAWSCLAPKELGGEVLCDDWLRSGIVDWLLALLLCVSSDCLFSFEKRCAVRALTKELQKHQQPTGVQATAVVMLCCSCSLLRSSYRQSRARQIAARRCWTMNMTCRGPFSSAQLHKWSGPFFFLNLQLHEQLFPWS